MCAPCRREYDDPPTGASTPSPTPARSAGPQLGAAGRPAAGRSRARPDRGAPRSCSRAGRIVAVKGLGGFHLAVRRHATPAAVARLRERKQREEKPFAVMVRRPRRRSRACAVAERRRGGAARRRSQRPIVLLRKRQRRRAGRARWRPGNRYVGAMLPYTPLHHLLLRQRVRGRW
ncbi:MAG: Sua5/YciO/YrdC/YwlC family protein [Desulfobacterales bacterium]|nr:Sua5/YciO/YrdC/YwlC family protein [Desulfobacterales bacterium]